MGLLSELTRDSERLGTNGHRRLVGDLNLEYNIRQTVLQTDGNPVP